jgi:hypothetical protein
VPEERANDRLYSPSASVGKGADNRESEREPSERDRDKRQKKRKKRDYSSSLFSATTSFSSLRSFSFSQKVTSLLLIPTLYDEI